MDITESVKKNLVIDGNEDDELIEDIVAAARQYAESFQHLGDGFYLDHEPDATTKQGIVMLASHLYESRDGSTAGFFGNNPAAASNVWQAVDRLLRLERRWTL